jgi:hypothetical protein
MAYNTSKGSRELGDIEFEGDPADTQIDFETDFIALKTNNTQRFIISGSAITAAATITPSEDNSLDLGSPSRHWANVYTGDLHLKNERGDWTVVEEEDCLTVRNNKTGKRYKLAMEEID